MLPFKKKEIKIVNPGVTNRLPVRIMELQVKERSRLPTKLRLL